MRAVRTKVQLLPHLKAEEGKQQQQDKEKEERDGLRLEVEEVSWVRRTLRNLSKNR